MSIRDIENLLSSSQDAFRDAAFAAKLDESDPLRQFRDEFVLPTNGSIGASMASLDKANEPCTYLCGNSLGAMPKKSEALVAEEFRVWGSRAVEAHFRHPHGREWMNIADLVTPMLAKMIGANLEEVACMGTLTSNLHLLMNSFYKPTSKRYKIICESKAFPSDQYAFASQAALHGFDPQEAVVQLSPREGEFTLREDDILAAIKEHGASVALVLFPSVQYYSGQWFPMQSITQAAHAQGSICGWDMAHGVGNVPLNLHDWDVDFAVWCSYKYLNAGPGSIGGLFIHDKWVHKEKPKYAGWWGHELATRFQMPPIFSPIPGAQGFQQSNPSVLATVSLLGSLLVFEEAGGIAKVREKAICLTLYLERMLHQSPYYVDSRLVAESNKPGFTIITPLEPSSRGSQLSLLLFPTGTMEKVQSGLHSRGVIGDERKPDVIRLAPIALYNTFEDCRTAAVALDEVFASI